MAAGGGIISTEAGATKEGKPFVITSVNGRKFGQLTPGEAIAMGLRCIQSAIEAERDAGFVKFMRENREATDAQINEFLAGLRTHRHQAEPPEGMVDLAKRAREAGAD